MFHFTLSVDFRDSLSAPVLEGAIASLDAAIKKRFARVRRVFIEAEARARQAGTA